MHEYSVVQSLLDLCEENARNNNATVVKKVVVKIGVMSGVEPHLLQVAFDTFKEGTMCAKAHFVLISQPIVICCDKCGFEDSLGQKNYVCPKCGNLDIRILDGEDAVLMSLELE